MKTDADFQRHPFNTSVAHIIRSVSGATSFTARFQSYGAQAVALAVTLIFHIFHKLWQRRRRRCSRGSGRGRGRGRGRMSGSVVKKKPVAADGEAEVDVALMMILFKGHSSIVLGSL